MPEVPVPKINRTALLVAVLSFSAIMFELIISRMSVFYLNYANSFIAIPLALFGLAIGSLHFHLGKHAAKPFAFVRNLLLLTAATALSFSLIFLLFSRFLAISNPLQVDWLSTTKTILFVVIFLPPFYFIGRLLTALFFHNRARIGFLYAGDLAGAALAAFATPIFFHFMDLPYLIFVCLLGMSLVAILQMKKNRWLIFVLLAAANTGVLAILVYLEDSYDFSQTVKLEAGQTVRELEHRWNEFSRVSLLRIKDPEATHSSYRMIHDNAESNVFISPYRPDQAKIPTGDRRISLPLLFGRSVKDVLVMFAGCGRQMIQFHDQTNGQARITGVEINPLVRQFAEQSPRLANYRLGEFYRLPNINMVTQEGRYFLENDPQKYDVIYVASDAATAALKTGHSRKYLDTREALQQYLQHLQPRGTMIFHCMPAKHRLTSFRLLYQEMRRTDLDQNVMLLAKEPFGGCDYLVYSPTGFSAAEKEFIVQTWPEDIQFLPEYEKNNAAIVDLIHGKAKNELIVTDDSPFISRLDFKNFRLFPNAAKLKYVIYYRSWIKIITLLAVGAGLLLIVALLYAFRTPMPPLNMMLYLLLTGFAYMLCEIALIAKLELFMGNPLYSMALLLTIFLLTNAVGSSLFNRLQGRLNMKFVPLLVAGIILLTVAVVKPVTAHWLGLSLLIKIPLAILISAPVGVCLGLFYPYVITWLHQNDKAAAVPITYALSTLSSVAGATYAMTMIINFGYTNLLYQAVVGYALLSVLLVVHDRVAKRG